MVSRIELDSYLGKNINTICPNGYDNAADNHCAHFVSHVLGMKFGATCRTMTHGTGPAASIRVHEVFARCPVVGAWDTLPMPLIQCLVFITRASNVNLAKKLMTNVPRKHVGIYCEGDIWHYSNKNDQVVRMSPATFSNHYPSPDNAMFYGHIP